MIRIHELFWTKEKAMQFYRDCLEAFPSNTFGTKLAVHKCRDGWWSCSGARFS